MAGVGGLRVRASVETYAPLQDGTVQFSSVHIFEISQHLQISNLRSIWPYCFLYRPLKSIQYPNISEQSRGRNRADKNPFAVLGQALRGEIGVIWNSVGIILRFVWPSAIGFLPGYLCHLTKRGRRRFVLFASESVAELVTLCIYLFITCHSHVLHEWNDSDSVTCLFSSMRKPLELENLGQFVN